MNEAVGTTPLPPMPYRARPPHVLLGVGAALLVSAGAALASAHGGWPARLLLLVLALTAAGFSLHAAWTSLRGSEEILAACATGLGVAAGDLGRPDLGGTPGIPVVLAVVFVVLHLAAPTTATWPAAAWLAAQLAVLRGLPWVPAAIQSEVFLCVALAGLSIALLARPLVARIALVTTAPWWVAGVVGCSFDTWAGPGAGRWLSAALMIAGAAGLLAVRLREVLEPLMGPPVVVPVVAGAVAGTAVTGATSSLGTLATTLAAYAGVLLANTAAASLTGWRRGLFLPVALAGGTVMTLLCVVQLVADARWSALCLLLVLTAVPTVFVAARRPESRPVALPTAIGCLAGAALLAVPDGLLTPVGAAVVLAVLYGTAMAAGSALDPAARRATARAAAVCAIVSVLLLSAEGRPRVLALVLAGQGLCTLGWAWRTARRAVTDDGSSRAGWRLGAAQLVLAAWVTAGAAGMAAVEWYSLPAAAGLLIGAGPALVRGPSWPAWGPGLLVAAAPSTLLAVATADARRAAAVLVVAAVVLVAGPLVRVRAPLMVGAGTELVLAFGFTARALPWQLGTSLVVGTALLAIGMLRERHPVAGFRTRLADLR